MRTLSQRKLKIGEDVTGARCMDSDYEELPLNTKMLEFCFSIIKYRVKTSELIRALYA